jgi:phage tail protein X
VIWVFSGKLAEHVVGQLIPAGLLVTVPVPPARATVNPSSPLNVAVTLALAARVKVQVPVPEQAPLQPAKVSFAAGVSLRVTRVLGGKLAEQVAGQLIPAGLLVMVPVPEPAKTTVNPSSPLKVAVTLAVAARVRVQVLVPEQAPLQPTNTPSGPGVSLRVILLFGAKLAEHVVGQLIPAGLLVTVPPPTTATVNPSPALNVAVTLAAAARVTIHVLVPEQPPLHPPKK